MLMLNVIKHKAEKVMVHLKYLRNKNLGANRINSIASHKTIDWSTKGHLLLPLKDPCTIFDH